MKTGGCDGSLGGSSEPESALGGRKKPPNVRENPSRKKTSGHNLRQETGEKYISIEDIG